MKRREFMKAGGLMGAAALAAGGAGGAGSAQAADPPAAKIVENMPKVKLGNLEVSRFILGSNPFWGYSHKNSELDKQMREFHTDERIAKILDEAASCGVTAMASPPDARWVDLYTKYLAGGGKLRLWIGQCHGPPENMEKEIDTAAKGGAKAIFIQGHRVEEQFDKGKWEVLKGWLERIRGHGLPAGLAAHYPEIHLEAEKRKLPADFYYQCFYNVTKSGDWSDRERALAVETILKIEKPVIAYKVLAAGRLQAKPALEFAFEKIRRKDGVCIGIFSGNAIDQIRENAILTEMLT